MGLKYRESKTLSDHLNDFHGILQQLLDMGIKFDDEIQGLILVGTHPDSWDTFRMTLCNSAPQGKITLDLDKVGILNEEMRNKSHGVSSSSDEAYVANNRRRSKIKAPSGRDKSRSKSHQDGDDRAATATDDDLIIIHDESSVNLARYETSWVIVSGASLHVTSRKEFFTFNTPGDFGVLKMGNDGLAQVVGVGDICLITDIGEKLVLKNVRHVLDIRLHLISKGKLDDEGYCNTFHSGQWMLTKGNLVLDRGKKHTSLYLLQATIFTNSGSIEEQPDPVRRSIRDRRPSIRYPSFNYVLLTDGGEHESFEEAMDSDDKQH
uniref:Retrovirus-related Pol polyprotein from transposon TNT 1-94-like beta-barrel domain-containing protein n=1 Tax=Chenopodium quinoa TaxID=63459 RepID=A0A803N8D2_CHEQI